MGGGSLVNCSVEEVSGVEYFRICRDLMARRQSHSWLLMGGMAVDIEEDCES